MTAALPRHSRRIVAEKVPKGGQHAVVLADEATLADIAALLDLPRVETFSAHMDIRPMSRGRFAVTGQVKARVWQTCVVSLEDFPCDVDEKIEAVFAEPERLDPVSKNEVERALSDEDPPEPLDDGTIDVGALAVEFVALSLQPFPRKPGAVLDAVDDGEPPPSPFAALAALKAGPR
jgi:uncharacterized metal-binding protein YceD (DUF177 family)